MKSIVVTPRIKIICAFVCLAITMFLHHPFAADSSTTEWQIVVSEELQRDEAVRVALDDLKETGAAHGLLFTVVDDAKAISGNAILVGEPSRNRIVAQLATDGTIHLQGVSDEQGCEIITKDLDGRKIVVVAGGSIIGDVYGLYWIWDRIRVYKELPPINIIRTPRLKTRLSLSWGRHGSGGESKEAMRRALRYGINWVSGPPILDLVPWNSEPERTNNEKNREKTRELIEYAHSLHLKYYSFANEFTYHPSLLQEFDASLTPSDPRFWDALQAKFRRLFQALPELDGIELCNDDISGFWDDYQGFDLMHEGEGCDWRLDKRFRTFVKKVHDVVVVEFNKIYFHFTWSLVSYEQHNQADVYKSIFTDDIPVKNLYLIPKITAADRWWHQPYNPTFNQSPHNTIVGFETMNYYEGGGSNIFPTFSGQYFQAGLQTFLSPPDNNLKGAGYLVGGSRDSWDTRSAYSYVLYRLSWDPDEDIQTIAEDFCAIHFGRAAAEGMAEIYLLTPVAYKYGLHIEPVSYGTFNSFIHMRVGTFPAMGYPSIDGGKEHLDFLRQIYLRCKPWKAETLDDLDHGLATAAEMVRNYTSAKSLIDDEETAEKVSDSLNMTRLLIETNNLYVRTFFAYFGYRECPTPESKETLSNCCHSLKDVRERFVNAPGFGYRLFGVDQLLLNVDQVLADLKGAEARLERMPTREKLELTIDRQQLLYKQVLEKYQNEAVKFFYCDVMIDGRDILNISGDACRVEHLRWDGPHFRDRRSIQALPKKPVTVIPLDIQSRPMHPFILEQPTAENDYTVRVYLYDKPGGQGLMKFDLYYIPKSPAELGLEIPWEN
ncbi:MAG: hypothetical protein ABIH23_30210 [bacterium]